ncbi:helix-turn-helix transcriptional regulator [Embleya sp. NPDC005575]|uniref:helix-turn-helix domain-containing protein n=1 Tax=Embleya sp. NPDC005575 TaxID=3156892 RepID=UPI0033BA9323
MNITPKLARKRLGEAFRALRDAREMTGDDAAAELGWHASKISRIENAESGTSRHDFDKLVELYGAGEPKREELALLLSASKSRAWWNQTPYAAALTPAYRDLIGYERESYEECDYQPLVIPGLLQIPDYARVVIASGPFVQDYERIDTLVEVRERRQDVLLREDFALYAVVTLAALIYEHGGRDVLRAQLEHVLEVTERPNVTLQVIPHNVSSGGYTGSVTLLHFPEDPSVAYLDTVVGSQERDNPREVRQYARFFDHLRDIALSKADTRALITQRLEELK